MRSFLNQIAAVMLVLGSAQAIADDSDLSDGQIQERRRMMAEKKADFLSRLDRIDDLGRAEGVYVQVRSLALSPTTGLPAVARTWQDQASAWIKAWDDLLKQVDQASMDTSGSQIDAIRDQLSAQSKTYTSLRLKAEDIVRISQALKTQLASVDVYPDGFLPSYAPHLQSFNKRVSELRATLDSYHAQFGDGLATRWQTLTARTSASVEAKLKVALLKYPQLEGSLNLARQAFDVSAKSDPAALRTSDAYDLYTAEYLAKKPFHAADALTALVATASRSKTEIQASGLEDVYVQPAIAAVDAKVAGAQQLARQPIPANEAQLVAAYAHTQQLLLSRKCRDSNQAPHYNCELLRTLNRFDRTTILGLTEADLRQLEYAFDKVKK